MPCKLAPCVDAVEARRHRAGVRFLNFDFHTGPTFCAAASFCAEEALAASAFLADLRGN